MAKRKYQRLSDIPKATLKRLEREVLAQAKRTIERAEPQTIKQAVCNLLAHPILIAAICAEVERVEKGGPGW